MPEYRCECCGEFGWKQKREVMYHMENHVTVRTAKGERNLRRPA